MVFELRHYDTALLRFDAQMDTLAMEAKILWVSEEHRALLPLSLDLAPAKIAQWLKLRIIPQRRENAHALLAKSGLNFNRPTMKSSARSTWKR